MKFIKIIYLLFFTTFLISCQKESIEEKTIENAYLVSKSEALNIAKKFIIGNDENISGFKSFIEAKYNEKNIPAYYVVNMNLNGKKNYVLVNADKRDKNIVISFGDNEFRLHDMPEQLETISDNFSKNVDYNRSITLEDKKNLDAFEKRISLYKGLNTYDNKRGDATIGPFTTTLWGQGCCYNSLLASRQNVPVLNSDPTCDKLKCDKAYTGCVQTCIAQVVAYYGSMPGIDYSVLKNSYDSNDIGTKSGNLVATLMKKLYVIARATSDRCTGSGSRPEALLSGAAATKQLGIKNSVVSVKYDPLSDEHYEIIKSELRSGNLVVFEGRNTKAGHAWLADGIKILNGLVYVRYNWGWDGVCNGWYAYGSLTNSRHSFESSPTIYYNIRKL